LGVRVGRAVTTGVGVQVLVLSSPVPPSDAVAWRFCAPTTATAANSKTSETTATRDNENGDFIDDLHSVAKRAGNRLVGGAMFRLRGRRVNCPPPQAAVQNC
jgi:hypothetical protein